MFVLGDVYFFMLIKKANKTAVRSTARNVLHLQIDISSTALGIRALHTRALNTHDILIKDDCLWLVKLGDTSEYENLVEVLMWYVSVWHACSEITVLTIDLVLIDQLRVGKRSLHLMDSVKAKKRWTTIYWRVNIFFKKCHIVTRLDKERASFLKINDIDDTIFCDA
jgi:hypothetical protein